MKESSVVVTFLNSDRVECKIRLGQFLLSRKKELKHGEWKPWLLEHYGKQHIRSCQNAMKLARLALKGKITKEMYDMGAENLLKTFRKRKEKKEKMKKPKKEMPFMKKLMLWFNALDDGAEFTTLIAHKIVPYVSYRSVYMFTQFAMQLGAVERERRSGHKKYTFMKITNLPDDAYEQFKNETWQRVRKYKKGKKKLSKSEKLAFVPVDTPDQPSNGMVMVNKRQLEELLAKMSGRIQELSKENEKLKTRTYTNSDLIELIPKDVLKEISVRG
jgi:hypothetical protein